MRILRASIFIPLLLLLIPSHHSWAGPVVHIKVTTILASQKGAGVDPSLQFLTKDLGSVFRYSSYKELGQNRLSLKLNRPGKVALPGNRVLHITPQAVSDGRATLKLVITSRKRQIFQTVIRLKNNSSLTVGGPKHRGGYLMFNIYNSF